MQSVDFETLPTSAPAAPSNMRVKRGVVAALLGACVIAFAYSVPHQAPSVGYALQAAGVRAVPRAPPVAFPLAAQASVVAAPESAMHVSDLANIMAVHGGAPARAGMAVLSLTPGTSARQARDLMRSSYIQMKLKDGEKAVVIGVAADSGCGKSTFMRRLTSIFGGECKLLDIGRETNTLVSDTTTVICLDDYHKWDREGRKSNPEWPNGITALHADCQDWDKMASDVTNLKNGKTVDKPIYNHITGELDPVETVSATDIVIFEGLHPMYDERVNNALDLTVYLDITDEVKFAWKAQRDIAERGATMEEVQKAIDGRKPDFAAYVEPQKEKADIIVQVLLSDLIDDPTGQFLKVKLIQKKSAPVKPAYLMDEGASVEWVPNKEKLRTSAPGVKLASYEDMWYGQPVSVIEMDGKVDSLEDLSYVETHLCNTGTEYYGELSEQILKNKDSPGSDNGTGLFQTICSFKIREAFNAVKAAAPAR
jgi:phosphoribulokinase